jgi:alpha-tubulin suppressor-like RCC1 family protein
MAIILTRRPWAQAAALAATLTATACSDTTDEPTAPTISSPVTAAAAVSTVFKQVSSGGVNCGVATDGRAYCWGVNFDGGIGDGTRENRDVPTPVSGGLVFRNLSAGETHTCGVTTDDKLYCWGANFLGQLGDGTTTARLVPTLVKGRRFYAIASLGASHTCALAKADHRAFCWGGNSFGQLGDGTTTERHVPVAVAGGRTFSQIDAGQTHTCAVTPGSQAYCWGGDFRGSLGDGGSTPQRRTTPSLVAGKHAFTQISAGLWNTCALNLSDQVFCWGEGPTGDGTLHRWYTPVRVAGDLTFREVFAANAVSAMCGLSSVGKAYCWGFGDSNLGDGNPDSHNDLSPVAVVGGHTFAQVSVGDGTCGRTREGVIWCWGYGGGGSLGNGSFESSAVPVRVNDPQ